MSMEKEKSRKSILVIIILSIALIVVCGIVFTKDSVLSDLGRIVEGQVGDETKEETVDEPVVIDTVVIDTEVKEPQVTVLEASNVESLEEESIDEDPSIEEVEVKVTEESVVETTVVEKPVAEKPVEETPVEEPALVEVAVSDTPVTEVTKVEPTKLSAAYISTYSDVSASVREFAGSIGDSSKVLELSTASHDFQEGYGILVEGAGNDSSMNNWLRTTVTKVNGNQLTLKDRASVGVMGAEVHHDDTEAVQRAISTGLSTYYFDVDSLNVKGLHLNSNTTYDGLQRCKLYIPMAYSAVPYVQFMIETRNKSNVTFRNFTIDGNHDKGLYADIYVGVAMIHFVDSQGITVVNNRFENSGFLSVSLRGTVSNALVEGNTMLYTDTGILAMPEWGGILQLNDITYRGNYIEGGTSEGINILPGMWGNLGTATNILIEDNVIKNKNGAGMQLGIRTSDIVVRRNDISGSNHGILTMDMVFEDASLLIAKNIDIIGNKIYDNKWHNIKVDGSDIYFAENDIGYSNDGASFGGNQASHVVIENNQFNSAKNAVGIYNVNTAQIIGNTFRDGRIAVYILGNSNDIQIEDNDLGGMLVRQ